MDYETPQFYRVIQYAREADRDVVDMVSGSPDWDQPEGLREGFREYADLGPDEYQYGPSAGLAPLRSQIAARRGVDRDRVLVTHGAAEANHLAMAGGLERFPGSEVLLADPTYPYYPGRATFLGADVSFVPVEDDGHLDPERVREHASDETAVIVVNSPNNPTGAVYGGETMADLAAVAEAHDALLVSDEVYDHFDFSGRFASALETESPNVAVTNAFSKSMAATGIRVGYAVFPSADGPTGDLLERARTRHMLTTITGSRPAQYAVHRALETTRPAYYADRRDLLTDRFDAFCGALDDIGAAYRRPEGGFYVMANLPDYPGTFEAVFDLVDEAGVAGMPGEAFGQSRDDWIRFAMATDRVETAAERLVEHLG